MTVSHCFHQLLILGSFIWWIPFYKVAGEQHSLFRDLFYLILYFYIMSCVARWTWVIVVLSWMFVSPLIKSNSCLTVIWLNRMPVWTNKVFEWDFLFPISFFQTTFPSTTSGFLLCHFVLSSNTLWQTGTEQVGDFFWFFIMLSTNSELGLWSNTVWKKCLLKSLSFQKDRKTVKRPFWININVLLLLDFTWSDLLKIYFTGLLVRSCVIYLANFFVSSQLIDSSVTKLIDRAWSIVLVPSKGFKDSSFSRILWWSSKSGRSLRLLSHSLSCCLQVCSGAL